ncbi:hypothetical protein [Streptomyces flavidovirens]|uniref:hypothetical protein n=1 Tax=Streptomyces flavidovirens TaxID=67298 RepID=UPI0036A7D114
MLVVSASVPASADSLPDGKFQLYRQKGEQRCIGWTQPKPDVAYSHLVEMPCNGGPKTVWTFEAGTGHIIASDGRCVRHEVASGLLILEECSTDAAQTWDRTPRDTADTSFGGEGFEGFYSLQHAGTNGTHWAMWETGWIKHEKINAADKNNSETRFGFRPVE